MRTVDFSDQLSSVLAPLERDVFAQIMPSVCFEYSNYCTSTFKDSHQGLMLLNSQTTKKIACACFLSEYVVNEAIASGIDFIVAKHPLDWIEMPGFFVSIGKSGYEKCKVAGVNVYVAHSQLDHHADFSPSLNFLRALGFGPIDSLAVGDDGFGYVAIQKINLEQLYSLIAATTKLPRLQKVFVQPSCQKIAIVSGGGDSVDYLRQAINCGCDTYVTGIVFSSGTEYARKHNAEFRKLAVTSRINLIGASHYGSELFGVERLKRALASKGFEVKLIEEKPKLRILQREWGNKEL